MCMICVKQHKVKTCVICTGIVWLVLPVTSLIATWLLCYMQMEAYYLDYTWYVHKTYKTYPEGEKSRFLWPSLVSTCGHVIYNGAYI